MKKCLSWQVLLTLNATRQKPWLCLGDFNEVLLEYEKDGGPPRAQGCMDRFKEALEDYELMDLGFEGDPFTWRNNSHTSDVTSARDWIVWWRVVLDNVIWPVSGVKWGAVALRSPASDC